MPFVAAISEDNQFGICTEVPSSETEDVLLAAKYLVNRNLSKFSGNYSIHVESPDHQPRGSWVQAQLTWL